jgi:hypothetical protein
VVNFAPRPLYPRGNTPGTHWIGGWVDPQSRSEQRGQEKILNPTGTRSPDPSVVQPVASRYTDYAIPAPEAGTGCRLIQASGVKSREIAAILVLHSVVPALARGHKCGATVATPRSMAPCCAWQGQTVTPDNHYYIIPHELAVWYRTVWLRLCFGYRKIRTKWCNHFPGPRHMSN